jgi:hypothetical protein
MYNISGTDSGIPLGLGIALAMNSNALVYFANLPERERQRIVERTHSIESKKEMRSFVDNLTKGWGVS